MNLYKKITEGKNKNLKITGSLFLILIILPWIYLLLMTIVYAMPTGRVTAHADEAIVILDSEGERVWMPYHRGTAILDNFSDKILVDTCLSYEKSTERPMWNALYSRGYYRYWHGYVVIMKPLLALFNYNQIRVIVSALHILMALLIFAIFVKKYNWKVAMAFGITWFEMSSVVITTSPYFNVCFYLIFLGMLSVLFFYKKEEDTTKMLFIFLLLGSFVGFFDLLTIPLAVVSMPLVIIVYNDSFAGDNKPLKELVKIIKLVSIFMISYGFTWASKWFISDWLIKTEAISSSFYQVLFRLNGQVDGNEVNRFTAVKDNLYGIPILYQMVTSPVSWILIVLCIIICRNWKELYKMLPALVIVIMPYIWYFALANHSFIHSWFTCRAQMGELMILLLIYLTEIESAYKVIKNKIKKKKTS